MKWSVFYRFDLCLSFNIAIMGHKTVLTLISNITRWKPESSCNHCIVRVACNAA